jgi:protocatechuate 3,4-dioxygenase beta subunit
LSFSRSNACAGIALIVLAGCGSSDGEKKIGSSKTESAPPPSCHRPVQATPEQTEGPYYEQGPPQRTSLVDSSVTGTRLSLSGRVLDTSCSAVARARVDFWQADGNGAYDNSGYNLRGYQLTDGKGRYSVKTVVPGLYEGRTRHIHVKVTPPDGSTLTTQLYFPGEPRNQSDGIFTPETVIGLNRRAKPWKGTFQFVVNR